MRAACGLEGPSSRHGAMSRGVDSSKATPSSAAPLEMQTARASRATRSRARVGRVSLHFEMEERQRARRFHLPREERALLDRVRAQARDELVEIARKGTPGRVNRELVRALGRSGLLGRLLPAEGDRGVSALE